jgi:hypothetical protein
MLFSYHRDADFISLLPRFFIARAMVMFLHLGMPGE